MFFSGIGKEKNMKENRPPKRVTKVIRALKVALETLKVTKLVLKAIYALWAVIEILNKFN